MAYLLNMITLKNVKTLSGAHLTHTIECPHSETIDCGGKLLMMPALIDTDAYLGQVSSKPLEMAAWTRRVQSYLTAGISTVFDAMPHDTLALKDRLREATQMLHSSNIPAHVHFFCNGDLAENFDAIGKIKASVVGLKISFGASEAASKTHAFPSQSSFERLFQIAAQDNLIVVISLNQEEKPHDNKLTYRFIEKAIAAAERYSTELCFQNVQRAEELKVIKSAKERGILVYTQVALSHLFGKDSEDKKVLFEGLKNNSIDFIGSAGRQCDPALMLPLLFEACQDGTLDMESIIRVTRINQESIFRLPLNKDIVLIDTETKKTIPEAILAKCPALTHLKGKQIAGWPSHIIAGGQLFTSTF